MSRVPDLVIREKTGAETAYCGRQMVRAGRIWTWGQPECRSSVSTWLMSIARHKALSACRRRTDAELDEKIEATIADPADDPEVALQEKDRDELLRRALTRLSPGHREVIDLVYYHEKSIDEVAQILDVPAATVKTRMFYARKKLAELINEVRC
jgi:RNA polymerase sigma-70 factor (ECF subfamily)